MEVSNSQIMVSIVCNAFNHEKYIRDALEGFVAQKTEFPFEILVHDDASTDKTAEIIKEFEEKYPEIVKPIYQTENQYSKGIRAGGTYQYPRAKGKYIAFCEGDDYWTDPMKLQKQYDALEANPDADICAHSAMIINASNGKKIGFLSPSDRNTVLSQGEVIYGGGGYVSTNSLMFKKELVLNPMNFRKHLMMDYTLQIQGSLRGGMIYLKDCMSVYRSMAEGSWTSRMVKSPEFRENLYRKKQEMLQMLDKETDGKYSDIIQRTMVKTEYCHLVDENKLETLRSAKYKGLIKEFPLKKRMRVRIKMMFPFLIKIVRRFKR